MKLLVAQRTPMLAIDDLINASFAEGMTTLGDVGVCKCLLAYNTFSELAHYVFNIDLDSLVEL